MTPADLPAVAALADEIHPAYPEQPAVFAERLRLFPEGCLILADGSLAVGYAISHPGLVDRPPPLDTLIGRLPEAADCLYLHDVAIAASVARQGHGTALLDRLSATAAAHRLPRLALIAVNNAAPFWRRLGFRPAETPLPAGKLASYGADACYMLRDVVER
jgi:GNAT superfamily N-acetyltransferase